MDKRLLLSPNKLVLRHLDILSGNHRVPEYDLNEKRQGRGISAVLLLIGWSQDSGHPGPCLILNKRSAFVRQAGDICCPGGGVEQKMDRLFAGLLKLPCTPLTRWPMWRRLRRKRLVTASSLSLLFATGLRESLEEMRLNPLGVTLLGPLQPQQLVMFRQTIYPFVCWVESQKQFYPNWEVEKVVRIPLALLLSRTGYGRLRLQLKGSPGSGARHPSGQEFPCFSWVDREDKEILWGATFRIITQYLHLIFEFTPPEMAGLPLIQTNKDASYLSGRARPTTGGS